MKEARPPLPPFTLESARTKVRLAEAAGNSRFPDIIDMLQPMAQTKGASVAQLALDWLLHQPGVTSVLLGTRKIEQLDDNLGAANIVFSAEDLQQLGEVSRLSAEYPGWMLDFWSGDRTRQLQEARQARAPI